MSESISKSNSQSRLKTTEIHTSSSQTVITQFLKPLNENSPSSVAYKQKIHCPICSIELTTFLAERQQLHVNICLDQVIKEEEAAKLKEVKIEIKQTTEIKTELISNITQSPSPKFPTNELENVSTIKFKNSANISSIKEVTESTLPQNTLYQKRPPYSRGNSTFKSACGQPCPFRKKVPGTNFSVDAFRYGRIPSCNGYFLTHFHSDHYGGLTSKFDHGLIYCSEITANLVMQQLRVKPCYIQALPMNTPCAVSGVTVTLLEANHCPGSAVFLFEIPNTSSLRVLHTGDFRANEALWKSPIIKNLDYLFLDTTYCNPCYSFPSQQLVIDSTVKLVKDWVHPSSNNDNESPGILSFFGITKKCLNNSPMKMNLSNPIRHRKLVVVGTYTIGKEKIFLAVAQAMQSKIYVTSAKKRILGCLNDSEIQGRITSNPLEAMVHVGPMNILQRDKLREYLVQYKTHFDSVMGIRPTGWTFKTKSNSNYNSNSPNVDNNATMLLPFQATYKSKNVMIYGVPYSEHSAYSELRTFIRNVCTHDNNKTKTQIVATVKPPNITYQQLNDWINSWLDSDLPCPFI